MIPIRNMKRRTKPLKPFGKLNRMLFNSNPRKRNLLWPMVMAAKPLITYRTAKSNVKAKANVRMPAILGLEIDVFHFLSKATEHAGKANNQNKNKYCF